MKENVKPISPQRLAQIFQDIGLSRDQIAAKATGRLVPGRKRKSKRERPKCLVCGQLIGECKPFRQSDAPTMPAVPGAPQPLTPEELRLIALKDARLDKYDPILERLEHEEDTIET